MSIALSHQEKWDGSGYPDGLVGEEIPIFARIVAVADAFDAMTSIRAYRGAIGKADAIRELKENRSRQFDPQALDAFLQTLEREPENHAYEPPRAVGY